MSIQLYLYTALHATNVMYHVRQSAGEAGEGVAVQTEIHTKVTTLTLFFNIFAQLLAINSDQIRGCASFISISFYSNLVKICICAKV